MKNGYAGKIGNQGAQCVEAPNKHKRPADQSKVLKGKDLRTKGGGKKG